MWGIPPLLCDLTGLNDRVSLRIKLCHITLEWEITLFLIVLIELTSILWLGLTADLDFVTDLILLTGGFRTCRPIHDECQLLVIETVDLSSIQESAS